MTREELRDYVDEQRSLNNIPYHVYSTLIDGIDTLEQEPCEDAISRKSIKQKLQEHHDFFVNAYGGFSNLPLNDKSRVDEITNCIAMVVNEPPVIPQEPITWIVGKNNVQIAVKNMPIDKLQKICAIIGDEQEPVIDKIRVEVENINVWGMRYNPDTDKDRKPQIVQKVKEHVIEILDKYKAETEET